MIDLFTSPARSTPVLRPGQAVHVNTGQTWLAATVVLTTRTRVGLQYTDPRRASTSVPRWLVRPADRVTLQPVHRLRVGANVLAYDGTELQVVACCQRHNRWWDIYYAHGARSTVAPRSVLRVADPTPPVTIHGRPLCDLATEPRPAPKGLPS